MSLDLDLDLSLDFKSNLILNKKLLFMREIINLLLGIEFFFWAPYVKTNSIKNNAHTIVQF